MSEKYNKKDFYNNANVGTQVYNSETDTYYIKTEKGWRKNDDFWLSLGTRYSELAMKGSIQYHSHKQYYNNTIGKDGSFNLHKDIKGFTITNDHPLAERFETDEQKLVQLRIDAPKLKQYNALIKHQKERIEFYEKQYPHLKGKLENIFKEAHASGNPKEYLLKNHNLHIGSPSKQGPSQFLSTPTPTGKISSFYFDTINTIANLEKELNINQPEEIKGGGDAHTLKDVLKIKNTGNGTNGEKVNTNNTGNGTNGKKDELLINKNINNEIGKIVSSDTSLKGLFNGKEKINNNNTFEHRITSNGKNGSNNNNNNNTLKDNRFSWEKDLNTKQAKELQNIRNVFGDYRKELNISKRDKGSNTNRRRLTGPMDQHTAEMLGLL